jgi:hypothetical protein
MRQEQLEKIRKLFISLGGLSADLKNSTNLLNTYAAQNVEKARAFYLKTSNNIDLKVI